MIKEQFYSMYTQYSWRIVIRNYTHRRVYKHWNNWCVKGSNGKYCFEKGYDEDYVKRYLND